MISRELRRQGAAHRPSEFTRRPPADYQARPERPLSWGKSLPESKEKQKGHPACRAMSSGIRALIRWLLRGECFRRHGHRLSNRGGKGPRCTPCWALTWTLTTRAWLPYEHARSTAHLLDHQNHKLKALRTLGVCLHLRATSQERIRGGGAARAGRSVARPPSQTQPCPGGVRLPQPINPGVSTPFHARAGGRAFGRHRLCLILDSLFAGGKSGARRARGLRRDRRREAGPPGCGGASVTRAGRRVHGRDGQGEPGEAASHGRQGEGGAGSRERREE